MRLKAILFLANSSNYDVTGVKKDLEEMEVNGLRGLTLERAIVYGKVGFPPLFCAFRQTRRLTRAVLSFD